jgi:hypothetical protein
MSAIEKIAKGDERIGGKRRPSFFWIEHSRQSIISTLAALAITQPTEPAETR